ncbi:MAG TPA: MFS transporter [Candidatus Methylomirabilis sp.]|nr:MFS transporter [Candidatus Methylomirabilis sp.]
MSAVAPGGRGWLLAISASRLGVYMAYIAYAATLPVLQHEWSLSGTMAGSIASAFQVAYAVSLTGCSALADRVGARRVFLGGTAASAIVAIAFAALARGYASGLALHSLLALALGGTYTTGILLVAENIPVERRGRAMGMYLAGHSLGLALALVLAGAAIPRGGYVLAFWFLAAGPVLGGALAWLTVRSTPNVVAPRAGGQRFGGEVLKNRPAMLIIAGYTFHSWELLGMWAWTPAFLAACFVAAGSDLTRGAGLGAYMTSLFHLTGMIASLLAGVFADRFGRTPVILVMASVSAACSLLFGWLIGASLVLVLVIGLLYGFAALGDSPIYSTAITEIVAPAYRGSALALRSLLGYGAGALAPLLFGAILDWYGIKNPGAWGWAFVSLGVAGMGAVASVVRLQRMPEASALHGRHMVRRSSASAPAR